MNTKLALLVLSVVIIGGIQLVPALADTEAQLLAKITELEKKVADKDLILLEQIKVIMSIKDNYKIAYEPFNEIKFASTGGFNPEWLEGERSKIIDTCNNFNDAGYNPSYCQFVQ